eukprot:jgi/Mesen1/6029/ME000308S05222
MVAKSPSAKSPAKPKAAAKPRAPAKRPDHPKYSFMVSEAIAALKEKTGSSMQAIVKFIEEKYKGKLSPNYKKLAFAQAKKLVTEGKLVKVKASFKLSDELKKEAKAAKPKVAKPVGPAKTSPAAKPKKATSVAKPKKAASAAKPKVASKPKNVVTPKKTAVTAKKVTEKTTPKKVVAAPKVKKSAPAKKATTPKKRSAPKRTKAPVAKKAKKDSPPKAAPASTS